VAGFNVNTIAIEIPINLLTSDGAIHAATDPKEPSAPGQQLQNADHHSQLPNPIMGEGSYAQVQRLAIL